MKFIIDPATQNEDTKIHYAENLEWATIHLESQAKRILLYKRDSQGVYVFQRYFLSWDEIDKYIENHK